MIIESTDTPEIEDIETEWVKLTKQSELETLHYRIGDEYIGGFNDPESVPNGAVECPAPESATMEWDGNAWFFGDRALTAWRNTTSLKRHDFCISLLDTGVLSDDEALAAHRGEWPPTFDGFLADMPKAAQTRAQMEWVSAQHIRRNHPMIEGLRLMADMTPEQVDELFGWQNA